MQTRLKRALKYNSIIALIYPLYLNVFVPVTFSFQQVFLIAREVVKINNQRGFDITTILSDELDQMIELVIVAVKRVFKENGFCYDTFINSR